MPATDLFTRDELASYMLRAAGEVVDNSTTDVCQRVASGWLKWSTGLSDWTVPVDDQLFAWALELAAIAYRNPDGMAVEAIDDYTATWDRSRRKQILDAARTAYSAAGQPQYEFPDPDWHWGPATPNSAITA